MQLSSQSLFFSAKKHLIINNLNRYCLRAILQRQIAVNNVQNTRDFIKNHIEKEVVDTEVTLASIPEEANEHHSSQDFDLVLVGSKLRASSKEPYNSGDQLIRELMAIKPMPYARASVQMYIMLIKSIRDCLWSASVSFIC